MIEEYQRLAAVVAVCGEVEASRLQKLVHVLRVLGSSLPYEYRIVFGHPYSEDLESDLQLLEQLKLIERKNLQNEQKKTTTIISATKIAKTYIEKAPELKQFHPIIKEFLKADPAVLDLVVMFGALRSFKIPAVKARKQLWQIAGEIGKSQNHEVVEELLSRWKLLTY
jgi:uncharacterized protein YwgA